MKIIIKLTCCLFLFQSFFYVNAQENYSSWKKNFKKGIEKLEQNQLVAAQTLLKKAYDIAQNKFDEKNKKLETTGYTLAYLYEVTGDYEKALPLYLKSINILRATGNNKNQNYLGYILHVANICKNTGEFATGIELLFEYKSLVELEYSTESFEYAYALSSLSSIYKKSSDFDKALKFIEQSNRIIEKLYGNQSAEYAKGLTNLCQIYRELGQYDKAIPIQKKSVSLFTEKNAIYANALVTLSALYDDIGEYQKEIELLNEAKEILDETNRNYIDVLNNLAKVYGDIGDFENNLKLTLKVIEKTPKTDSNYPIRLLNLAYAYSELGEFDKASMYYKKSVEACLNIYGDKHPLYSKIIDALGQHYYNQSHYIKSKEQFEIALSSFLKSFDENHPQYGFYLNNYTKTLLALNEYDRAIGLIKQNINLSIANSETDNERFFKKQLSLAQSFNQTGKYNQAYTVLATYIEKFKQKLGTQHPDYRHLLKSLGRTHFGLGNIEKAITLVDSSNQILISEIDKVFKFRSEQEKRLFLKTIGKEFDELQSFAFHLNKPSDYLNQINLDNQIMLKGLLLNNSKNLLSGLSSLKDSTINKKIISYRVSKNLYSKTISLPFEKRQINTDSLDDLINNKESELVKLYNLNFKNENVISGNWQSIKQNLKPKDIAIEFSHFRLTTNSKITDSIMYVAYIYKSGWKTPEMIPLFEEKKLKTILNKKSPAQLYVSRGSKSKNISVSTDIYDLVWKPLEKVTSASETIYFSPSGLLNQISFAAMRNENSPTLSARHNLIQLSNLGALSKVFFEPKPVNTLFIGGVIYDYKTTSNTSIKNIEKIKDQNVNDAHWNYLPGTLKEVHYLENIFLSKKKQYKSLIAENANEANFKKLSGNSPNIIHIATHGFFKENIQNSLKLNTKDEHKLSEDPLIRSGLILAGANYSWKHGYNPHEEEDGILTALEISNLDLSNTDMVVLSACETGLGVIDGSEGVYGLQRAFKMAGVDIIVMSLWQVPDEETAEFMNLFYTNWLNSNKVKEAFNTTQRTMQKKYNDQPKKWGAFVLFE